MADANENELQKPSDGDNKKDSQLLSDLIVNVGTNVDDEIPVILNLKNIPHILVCGSTGTGKTLFVQKCIVDLAKQYDSEKVDFIFYDSKGLEYNFFNGLPQKAGALYGRFNSNQNFMLFLNKIYESRVYRFRMSGTSNINKYNQKADQPIPNIFVIIDDFNGLVLDDEQLENFELILSHGRNLGIHFILITSTPNDKRITKNIIYDIPCRIAFRVTSRSESKIILDEKGAESLLQGEFIYKNGYPLIKGKVPEISIDELAEDVQKITGEEYENKELQKLYFECTTLAGLYENGISEDSTITEDPLFEEAKEYVIEVQKASTSLLQRRFGIGYNRAARLIEAMEEKRIIGPARGSAPREVFGKNYSADDIEETTESDEKPEDNTIEQQEEEDVLDSVELFDAVLEAIKNKHNDDDDDKEEHTLTLHDFPKYEFGDYSLCVENNVIYVKVPVLEWSKEIISAQFGGQYITNISYKPATLFGKGLISFSFSSMIKIDNFYVLKPDLSYEELSELIVIKFGYLQAKVLDKFVEQLAEDINIKIDYI